MSGWPGSRGALPVTPAALPRRQTREGVDRRARIGMRLQPAASFSADAAPLADQQSMAKQVGPDFQAVEAPFVAFGADTYQRYGFREERKLDRGGRSRGANFAAFRRLHTRSVSQSARFGSACPAVIPVNPAWGD
jgi:hypothetical protein